MGTHRDSNQDQVDAARSVLMELTHLLSAHRDSIVLVGGWVPAFICPGSEETHDGSIDVDLALDYRNLTEAGYRSVVQLLADSGYVQDRGPAYIFYRDVAVKGQIVTVKVDFLGEDCGSTDLGRREALDTPVFEALGVGLAFDSPVEIVLQGQLPDGVERSVRIRIASVAAFIVMKAIALGGRREAKAKDAYDIYYCLRNFPGGIDAVVQEFKPHLSKAVVQDGLQCLSRHFASVGATGPVNVADFERVSDIEEREMICRDAYEKVRYLLEQLGTS